MEKDWHKIKVDSVNYIHGRGPVYYASIPCAIQTLKGYGTDVAGYRHLLVSALWDHFLAMENPFWKHCQSSDRSAFPIQVVRGLLGKPYLMLGEYRGPDISFSVGGGRFWAALCGDDSDMGIDMAGTDEFHREYPFHLAFHPQELQHALRMAGGELEKASALLWSIKEAVVKALGCAFHLVDPRQITVYRSVEESSGYTFPVGLSGKDLARFPIGTGRHLWVRSFPHEKMWLSIALLNGQRQRGDGFTAS